MLAFSGIGCTLALLSYYDAAAAAAYAAVAAQARFVCSTVIGCKSCAMRADDHLSTVELPCRPKVRSLKKK